MNRENLKILIPGLLGLDDCEPIGKAAAGNPGNFSCAAERNDADIVYSQMPNVKALVVDDLPTNLLIARGLLEPYGLRVDTAASGQKAVEMVKAEDYDIVFMDHMMPEMDGVEALAAIRKIGGFVSSTSLATPVIALTANGLRGMKEFFLEQGFQDYLSKPINPQELDEVIKKWIKKGNGDQQTTIPACHFPLPIIMELESQRLDMLKHYQVSFQNIREEDYQLKFDKAYFERFTNLIESLGDFLSPSNANPQSLNLQEQAVLLAEAGRRGDVRTIRETLPIFYDTLRKQREEERNVGSFDPREILPRLKAALLAGEIESVEAIIREMGAVKLSSAGRELYLKLYELLLTGEAEKALEVIDLKPVTLEVINEEHHD